MNQYIAYGTDGRRVGTLPPPAPEPPPRDPNALTDRQEEVLEFLEAFIAKNGFPPTVRELRRNFGWGSTGTSAYHLNNLVKKGAITRGTYTARTIRIVEK